MSKTPPLIVEHLESEMNYSFLTLLEYKRVRYLTVIENLVDDEITAYCLDQLSAEGIDQGWFMTIALRWFYGASDKYPLSFEFAKLGKTEVVKRVMKTFNVASVSRVVGRLFVYNVQEKPKTRRRKVTRKISSTVTIKL
jgi:hypothetical protein